MVYLFYYKHAEDLKQEVFDSSFGKLPPDIQAEILKLKRKEDRNRKLIGRMLLMEAFKVLEVDCPLSQIRYSSQGRPYFNESLDFNISHSGSVVICAISTTHKVGVDVEKMNNITLNDFKNHFTKTEWDFIAGSSQPNKTFYDLWTKREAFLKAIGTGLSVELKNIEANWTKKEWKNIQWINTKIMLEENYCCHLCVNNFLPEMSKQEMNLE